MFDKVGIIPSFYSSHFYVQTTKSNFYLLVRKSFKSLLRLFMQYSSFHSTQTYAIFFVNKHEPQNSNIHTPNNRQRIVNTIKKRRKLHFIDSTSFRIFLYRLRMRHCPVLNVNCKSVVRVPGEYRLIRHQKLRRSASICFENRSKGSRISRGVTIKRGAAAFEIARVHEDRSEPHCTCWNQINKSACLKMLIVWGRHIVARGSPRVFLLLH